RDISQSVQSAADFTRRVSDQIKEVQGTATETEQAAEGVLHASADLAQQTDLLQAEVSGFLNAVQPKAATQETGLTMGDRRAAV
ncbi:MAG TPA: hypothetical protein VF917_13765, partial [Steroidobacteraceae bacterium]